MTIGTPPTSRTFHQSNVCNGVLFVMGGFDGMKRNDMYRIVVDQAVAQRQQIPVETDDRHHTQVEKANEASVATKQP